MTEPMQGWAVELLLDEAWDAHAEDRYGAALAAAERAVQAAEHLDDPVLLVRALSVEAATLAMQGDDAAALTRYTRILGLAEDPASRGRLEHPAAVDAVARAHMNWVEAARRAGGVPLRALFGVLDAGERYVRAVGESRWRAGLLLQRADTHRELGEWDAAVAAAQEALALYSPGAPGYTLATYRILLGDVLRNAGRAAEAEQYYQAVLDDPDSGSYDRTTALVGLAWCALDRDDPPAARRHAQAAVRDAEPLGDNAFSGPLEVLISAHRAAGDGDAAAAAADRYLQVARRLGGHFNLYYAVKAAVQVALDSGDPNTARTLLADLDQHAHALDTDSGTTRMSVEAAELRQQLTDLDPNP